MNHQCDVYRHTRYKTFHLRRRLETSLRPRLIYGREVTEKYALLAALPEHAFPRCSICFAAK
eukprot:2228301-Amphidinium_carterae.1